MAVLSIYKRTRATVNDDWSAWVLTTDIPPYTDTDLIEYKTQASNSIDISDITNNVNTDAEYVTTGGGYFDDLMETITKHLKAEYDSGRIEGDNYARVYSANITNTLNQSIQFALAKRNTELRADTAEEQLAVALETHDSKVLSAQYQADKLKADTAYTEEQTTQLPESVRYNNRIKGLDSLLDMMGTFGAGGLTFSDDQWNFMYTQLANLITDLNDYKGEWNALTNTPDISAIDESTLQDGDFYRVSTAGGTNLDGTDTWAINDIVVRIGDRWTKSDVIIPSNNNVTVVS